MTTPIRSLMLMLDIVRLRHEALDEAERREELTRGEWAPMSRTWSRQGEALSRAIIAEPPQTVDDVLAVLGELAGLRDLLVEQGEEPDERERRSLNEMTDFAIKNCIGCLAATIHPQEQPTEAQRSTFAWVSKQVAQWEASRC